MIEGQGVIADELVPFTDGLDFPTE